MLMFTFTDRQIFVVIDKYLNVLYFLLDNDAPAIIFLFFLVQHGGTQKSQKSTITVKVKSKIESLSLFFFTVL